MFILKTFYLVLKIKSGRCPPPPTIDQTLSKPISGVFHKLTSIARDIFYHPIGTLYDLFMGFCVISRLCEAPKDPT